MKSLINNLSASPVTAEDINAMGIEEIDDPELTETLKAEAVMSNIKRMQDYKTPLQVFDEKVRRNLGIRSRSKSTKFYFMNVTFVHQGSYSNQGGLWASDSDNRIGLTDQQAKAVADKVNKMWDPNISATENAKNIRYAILGQKVGEKDVIPESLSATQRAHLVGQVLMQSLPIVALILRGLS